MGRPHRATPVVHFSAIGSTNAEGLARAEGPAPLWIVAERQTAGRGRRGRPWSSEPGNLYASLLLRDAGPRERLPELCFVSALALHDAVRAVTGIDPLRIALKWPNDVLVDGGKLAGILLEGTTTRDGATATVIGFGVNCAHAPSDTPYPAASLAAAGFPTAPAALLASLDEAMCGRLAQWNRGAGFADIVDAWSRRTPGIGRPVEVRMGDRMESGIFEALDATGAMLLRRADGSRQTISAGDVFPSALR
ncbi:biotin--[acetyl-CoA-carboxylase] ligase [Bosea sp. 117]|uniref:biotin--[acetyl-CoA-carboxylase] ligase n=1 Tax=Bosea sp. 117 TaxID=1125973 RepID=UPI000494C93C|nr:biotin--[acetyl-CoA-carboxylase] ligase [Bosea sp. 117]